MTVRRHEIREVATPVRIRAVYLHRYFCLVFFFHNFDLMRPSPRSLLALPSIRGGPVDEAGYDFSLRDSRDHN